MTAGGRVEWRCRPRAGPAAQPADELHHLREHLRLHGPGVPLRLGFGRIVASEIEVPNMFANVV